MSPYKTASGGCESCGKWTEHGAKRLCTDCEKKKPEEKQCQYPDCTTQFVQPGKAKYCMEHRGLKKVRR